MKTTITIKGTHCEACKKLIEEVSKDVPGVQTCTVDFKTGRTEIEHDQTLNWSEFKKEIESLEQYQVELPA